MAVAVGGCDDGDGDGEVSATGAPENPDPHVRVSGPVDLLDLCGVIGATNVFMRAERVGCVDAPPAPCSLPAQPEPIVGETAGCPSAATARRMSVDVEVAGKYQIAAVTITETGTQELCFGVAGADVIEIRDAAIEAREAIAVEAKIGPCPEP
ncbi:MAG: hypothetical protein R3A79_30575 [Nannocystaceae bacterium]